MQPNPNIPAGDDDTRDPNLIPGAVRTASLTTYAAAGVYLLHRFTGVEISADDLGPLIVVLGPVLGVVWTVARIAEKRWPTLGTILFWSRSAPEYSPKER